MKILYDYQIFTLQKYGGISRYFSELFCYFSRTQDPSFSVGMKYTDNSYLHFASSSWAEPKKFLTSQHIARQRDMLFAINQFYARKALVFDRFDIFHPTYYNPYFLSHLGRRPFVLTVYDMTHELFPDYVSRNDATAKRKRLLVERADKIIAISQTTKDDLIRLFGVEERKVSVIHLASSIRADATPTENFPLPKRYILFVGTRWGYKNFDQFVRAVSPVMAKKDADMICAGGPPFSPEEKKIIDSLGIGARVHYFPATDDDLAYFYRHALVFVFPSLYEGFGIPVLESFACSCPALLSRAGSLPEIAGDAAAYFDPRSEEDIRSSLERLLDNETVREQLKRAGQERLTHYSWEQTAQKTIEVYRSI